MKKILLLLFTALFITININAQNARISGGYSHSVILSEDGTVYTFGDNSLGQLGLAYPYSFTYNSEPVAVGALPEIKEVKVGHGSYTMAKTCNGSIYTWGQNNYGQLGNPDDATQGAGAYSSIPVLVFKGDGSDNNLDGYLDGVLDFTAGESSSYALLEDSTVVAWGLNDYGQLGNGTSTNFDTPTLVQTPTGVLKNVTQIYAGRTNGYALTSYGQVYSWGNENSAQLGRPSVNQAFAVPVETQDGTPLSNITSIASGSGHCLFIDSNGNVWSIGGDWGNGQLGQGDGYQFADFANKVVGGASTEEYLGDTDPIVKVDAGQAHSVALSRSGKVYTWGANGFLNCGPTCSTPAGQLGINSTQTNFNITSGPFQSPIHAQYSEGTLITDAIDISTGEAWTFVINENNKIYATGWNQKGQLGTGHYSNLYGFTEIDLPNLSTPKANLELDTYLEVCEGFSHSIDLGLVYPGFSVKIEHDGNLTHTFSKPYHIDSVASHFPTYTIFDPGTWQFSIIDNRTASQRPCEPNEDVVHELIIEYAVPDFDVPSLITTCEDMFGIHIEGGQDEIFEWYTEITDGNLLETSIGNQSVYIAQLDLTEVSEFNSNIKHLYVVNASNIDSTIASNEATGAASLTPYPSNSSKLHFTTHTDLYLTSVDVSIYEFNPNESLKTIQIKDTAGAVVATSTFTTSQSGPDLVTAYFNIDLSSGSYTIEAAEQSLASYREIGDAYKTYYIDENPIIEFINTESSREFPAFESWDIKIGIPFLCNRSKIEVENITCVGLEDEQSESYKIYPNPSEGTVFIEFSTVQDDILLNVRSLNGQILSTQSYTNTNAIQTEVNLSKGIYILEIIGDKNQTTSEKLIIK